MGNQNRIILIGGKMLSHKELIAQMRSQPGYKEKYDEAAPEFELLRKMLEARKRAGLTQE